MKKKKLIELILVIGFAIIALQGISQIRVNFLKTERIITVGGKNCDIWGYTNQAIQLAVDALPAEGGTVKLSPGIYMIMAPVKLKSNVNLAGCGDSSILRRIDGYNSKITVDADLGEYKATVENSNGFKPGMSIQISDNKNWICEDISLAVITQIDGNTLYFDTDLGRNYKVRANAVITNAGSCIAVKEAQYVTISKLKIDGNKDKNDILDGCFGGGIAVTRSKNITINNVQVTDFNGEGITWQMTDSVTVMNSEINGCTNMGMHPGIGSPHIRVENNNSHDNNVGLFLCWRVTDGVVINNRLHHNQDCGISTGHKDSDMLFVNNHIYENGNNGVYFRNECSFNSPHRNTFQNNIIEDNGTKSEGYGFKIEGNATDILLKDNIIRNTAKGKQKGPVLILKSCPPIKLENNTISGHRLGNGILYE